MHFDAVAFLPALSVEVKTIRSRPRVRARRSRHGKRLAEPGSHPVGKTLPLRPPPGFFLLLIKRLSRRFLLRSHCFTQRLHKSAGDCTGPREHSKDLGHPHRLCFSLLRQSAFLRTGLGEGPWEARAAQRLGEGRARFGEKFPVAKLLYHASYLIQL